MDISAIVNPRERSVAFRGACRLAAGETSTLVFEFPSAAPAVDDLVLVLRRDGPSGDAVATTLSLAAVDGHRNLLAAPLCLATAEMDAWRVSKLEDQDASVRRVGVVRSRDGVYDGWLELARKAGAGDVYVACRVPVLLRVQGFPTTVEALEQKGWGLEYKAYRKTDLLEADDAHYPTTKAVATAVAAEASARQSAVSSESSARAAADTALGSRIDAEASARAAADTAEASARDAAIASAKEDLEDSVTVVSTGLAQEKTARANADTALGSRIDAEKSARESADTAESAARESADDALSGRVSALETAVPGKAAASHTHAISDVSDLASTLSGKAPSNHGHVMSVITGLETALAGKAASSHTHPTTDVTGLAAALEEAGKVKKVCNVEPVDGNVALASANLTDKDSLVRTSGAQSVSGVKTFSNSVVFAGTGDQNAVKLSLDTRINVSGTTHTVLGFMSQTFLISHTSYALNLRGKNARPAYNGSDLALKSDIPTKTSSLTNDSGFLTSHQSLDGKLDKTATAAAASELTDGEDSVYVMQSVSSSGVSKTLVHEDADGGIRRVAYASEVASDLAAKADSENLAPAYVSGTSYQAGDHVTKDGVHWKCKAATSTAPADGDYWEKVVLSDPDYRLGVDEYTDELQIVARDGSVEWRERDAVHDRLLTDGSVRRMTSHAVNLVVPKNLTTTISLPPKIDGRARSFVVDFPTTQAYLAYGMVDAKTSSAEVAKARAQYDLALYNGSLYYAKTAISANTSASSVLASFTAITTSAKFTLVLREQENSEVDLYYDASSATDLADALTVNAGGRLQLFFYELPPVPGSSSPAFRVRISKIYRAATT